MGQVAAKQKPALRRKAPTGLNRILGPGILMAAAAIGVSHLVQSTRAGANFGFQLLTLVVLINIVKWPFFEFGQRYGAATGTTILHGYRQLGWGYVFAFLAVSFVTMILSIALLTFVTAGLAANLFGGAESSINQMLGEKHTFWWAVIVILVCNGILFYGQYRALDRVTKSIIAILGVTAIFAAIVAFIKPTAYAEGFTPNNPWTFEIATFGFLVALMGWMPAPIELSAWPSVWMVEREEESGVKPSMKEALIDFNAGYLGAIVLSAAFLSLGALMMYPLNESFADNSVLFSAQLVGLFEDSIGPWIAPIVAIAAFTCIFSTTLTCLHGYPRTNAIAATLTIPGLHGKTMPLFWTFNLLTCAISLVVIYQFTGKLKAMVDLVTIVAFLTGPLFAFINLRVIRSDQVPQQYRPKSWVIALSWLGLLALVAVGIAYIWLTITQ